MRTLRFSIVIAAPKSIVWDTMLDDATYRVWTAEFMPGSYFVGDWTEGSSIRFLASGETGESGMVSRIRTNRRHEYLSIEHLGLVVDGKEDTTSEAAKAWVGAREAYAFRDVDGGTEVLVETDTDDNHQEMFQDIWPRALQRLKELAERRRAGPS